MSEASEAVATAPAEPEKPEPNPTAELEQRAVAAEAEARAAREQAAYAQGVAQAASRQAQPPAQPRVDPLDYLTKNELVMSPEEKRQALAAAIEQRAGEKQVETEKRIAAEFARREQAMSATVALQMIQATRRDLADPRNAPAFAGAMTKAKYEAESRGENLSYAELAARAVDEYDRLYPKSRPSNVPFVEGGARPDASLVAAFAPQPGPPQRSKLEKMYGIKKAGLIKELPETDENGIDWTPVTMEYLKEKNTRLLNKAGFKSDMEEVLRVLDSE